MTSEQYLIRQARLGHKSYRSPEQGKIVVAAGADMFVNYSGNRVQVSTSPREVEAESPEKVETVVSVAPLTITASIYGSPTAYDFTQYIVHIDVAGDLSDGRYDYSVAVNGVAATAGRTNVVNGQMEIPDFTALSAAVLSSSMVVVLSLTGHPDLQGVAVSASSTIGFQNWNGAYLVNGTATFTVQVGGETSGILYATDSVAPATYSADWIPFGVAGAKLSSGPSDSCAFSIDRATGLVTRADFLAFFGLGPQFLVR